MKIFPLTMWLRICCGERVLLAMHHCVMVYKCANKLYQMGEVTEVPVRLFGVLQMCGGKFANKTDDVVMKVASVTSCAS